MTEFVLDLSKPTHHFEVSVWHYADDRYSVDRDKGHGRATVYETDSKDKALGVAEYLEQNGRYTSDGKGLNGSLIENIGTPFDGSIVHWDCGDVDHGQDNAADSAAAPGGCWHDLAKQRADAEDIPLLAAADLVRQAGQYGQHDDPEGN